MLPFQPQKSHIVNFRPQSRRDIQEVCNRWTKRGDTLAFALTLNANLVLQS